MQAKLELCVTLPPLGPLQSMDNWDKRHRSQHNSQHFFFTLALYTQIFKCTSSERAENVPRNTALLTQTYRGISYAGYSSTAWNSCKHAEQGSQTLKVLFLHCYPDWLVRDLSPVYETRPPLLGVFLLLFLFVF